jgi:membrane protease YdiL (CAAX protease family)
MAGILVALIISWIILYLIEKENLLALGFLPSSKRINQFLSGFAITALLCIGVKYFEATLQSSSWVLNSNITFPIVVQAFWWDFKSVFTEELIFRGAILYVLIQRLGTNKAVLISAACFGIYHWFSFGILGNLVPMILIFIGTGFSGYVWALAFTKTKSILLPLGLHLGWNFVHNTVFSNGPLGDLILITYEGEELTGYLSLLNFAAGMIIVPLIQLIYVRYVVSENNDELISEKA